ncbi:MAG: sulfatase [Gemmataceae bacterium]|nr:sulfatase [Gemmataceae bacterium]MCI0742257.1 sulfatase [Gemmataceae bacterium]
MRHSIWILSFFTGMFLTPLASSAQASGTAVSLPSPSGRGVGVEGQKRPPNVVVIFADDLGYADLGCFGAQKIKTPHLDRMAKEGVRFTSFYTAQAVCSASRAALLTGKYSNRTGILGALGPASKQGLGPNNPNIALMLKALGYSTAIIGKWHLGHLAENLPARHGFDEYFGLPYSNDMWPHHPTAKFPDLPLMEGEKIIANNPDQTKLTTWYTEKAVDFIGRNKDRPFFLYVAHSMPHVPLFVSDRHKGKSAGGLYGDVIEELDWSVGEILAALKKHGIDDNTIVIFTSDNGPWLSYGNHAGSAGRLREGKGTAWEGGVRVPFIARWPGHLPAGKEQHEPAMTIDLLPTIARVTGAKLPSGKIDGKDISPLLRVEVGAKSPHEAYFFYWNKHLQAVRSGHWKLYFPHTYRTMAGSATGADGKPGLYKVATCGMELYNLSADLSETRDVAAQHPEVVRRLQDLADAMRRDLGDEPPKPKKAKAAK